MPQSGGLRDPRDFSASLYHTQTEWVKGHSILRGYWPGPSGQSKFFKPPPHTMVTTRRQWLGSDNKQIKRPVHKRFIASNNKGRPRSSLQGQLSGPSVAVNSTRSPGFLLRASPPSKGLYHKNSNDIGGTSKQPPKQKKPLHFFSSQPRAKRWIFRLYELSASGLNVPE